MSGSGETRTLSWACWRSPVGWLAPIGGAEGLRALVTGMDRNALITSVRDRWPGIVPAKDGEALAALSQLREFFNGRRRQFQLRLDFRSLSAFSVEVLQALADVPFGETVTYGELAGRASRPGAGRAVGRIMAGNPFPLVLPCHRVLGAGGRLTGYSGFSGMATKHWLLEFEKRLSATSAGNLVALGDSGFRGGEGKNAGTC